MRNLTLIATFAVYLIASPQLVHATPIVDCTKWKETESRQVILDAYNNIQTIADDLWYAKYTDSAGSTCTRFFLKNSNQTIWQNWSDNSGRHAYLLLANNTPYTTANSVVKWRIKLLNLFAGQGRIELGFFEGDQLTRSRLLDIAIHNQTPK